MTDGFIRAKNEKSQRETVSKKEVGLLEPHSITFAVLYSLETRPAHTLEKGVMQGHIPGAGNMEPC